jgi:hypothetical protein
MIAPLLALYAVTAVSLPSGRLVELPGSAGGSSIEAPASTLALSQRGSLAVITYPASPNDSDYSQLIVIRANGTRVTLPAPPKSVLSSIAENDGVAYFENVALADDGTPLATVAMYFSGAFNGTNEGILIWNGVSWRNPLARRKLPIDPKNATIAAAETPAHFVWNGDYTYTFGIIDDAEERPHYLEDQAATLDTSGVASLGFGLATEMRGRFVVGFSAEQGLVEYGQPHPSTALEWTGGTRTALGAGVAYGVNAAGAAVGDDEASTGAVRKPTLWSNGHAIRLSDASGSAYAIADDGTIVGVIGDHAFLIRGADAARTVVRLDSLVEPGWHIKGAYAIAASGRILAIGNRAGAAPRVLLLDPGAGS